MNQEIIPSILVYSADEMAARLNAIGNFVSTAQLDVLDNSLVPYTNFHDPEFINRLALRVSLEVHLMVKDVRLAIEQWNYPWVKKIIFHFESGISPQTGCRQIRSLGKLPGIAIAPQTPVESVLSSLSDVDTILVMTVEPGRNGAEFLPQMLDKVRMLRAVSPRLNIEVDGGVNLDTLKSCAAAGANLFVVGSYLKNEEFGIRLKALTQILR